MRGGGVKRQEWNCALTCPLKQTGFVVDGEGVGVVEKRVDHSGLRVAGGPQHVLRVGVQLEVSALLAGGQRNHGQRGRPLRRLHHVLHHHHHLSRVPLRLERVIRCIDKEPENCKFTIQYSNTLLILKKETELSAFDK